jgi:hypothetical protein
MRYSVTMPAARVLSALLLCGIACAAFGPSASAATWTVSGVRGSNQTGNGSAAAPWKTIAWGIINMAPGDTLEIEGIPDGAYDEHICNVPSGSDWEHATTLRGRPGPPVVILPTSDWGPVVAFAGTGSCLGGRSYVVLDNLVIDGSRISTTTLTIKDGSHHIRIANSEIRNAPLQNCVLISHGPAPFAYSDYNELINVEVHHCGLQQTDGTHPHGLYLATSYNRIEDSRFHDTLGYAIHIYNQLHLQAVCTPGGPALCCDAADPHRCEASHNTLLNSEADHSKRDGLLVSCGTGNLVHGCVLHDNALNGLRVDYDTIGTSLYNNVVYDNGGNGIAVGYNLGFWVQDTTVIGNIAYHTGASQQGIAVAPTASGTNRDFNYPAP